MYTYVTITHQPTPRTPNHYKNNEHSKTLFLVNLKYVPINQKKYQLAAIGNTASSPETTAGLTQMNK